MTRQKNKKEKLVASLAMLKVNWDQGFDYIENFVPFIAECLRLSPQSEVSLPQLQSIVASEFGLSIPQGALMTILKRAVKRGFASRRDEIYVRNEKAITSLNFTKMRSILLRKQAALIEKFIKFCSDRYQTNFSIQDAESALYNYLENHSIPILRVIEGELDSDLSAKHIKAGFLIRAFVAQLCKSDPEGFEFLETIVKGSMLASTLYFPDMGAVKKRFDKVEIYFDTSFLLQALGFGNLSMQTYCREALDLLYELDGKPRCFEHTLDEIRGILNFAALALKDRKILKHAYSDVVWLFIEKDFRVSDVELILSRLEESLRSLRIQVVPKPRHQESLGVDETKLASLLHEKVMYRTDEQVRHDLESLTAVFRLRRGEYPINIERCQALFVTTNQSLVRASNQFFKNEDNRAHGSVPVCTSASALITLIWLKKPTRSPDLPTKRIIADCYAALNPSDFVWKTYLKEIDRLQLQGDVSEEDYFLLRFSSEARLLLVDTTLGIPDAIAEGTIKEILEKAKAKIRSGVEAAYSIERKRRLEAEERASKAEAQFNLQLEAQSNHIRSLCVKWSKRIGILLLILVIALQAFMSYLTFPKPFPPLPDEWVRYLLPAFLILTTVLTIANITFGTTLRPYIRELEVRLSHFLEKVFISIFTPKVAISKTE